MNKVVKSRFLSPIQRQNLERGLSMVQNIGVYGRNAAGEPMSEVMARDIQHALDFDKDPDPKELKDILKLYKDAYSGDKDAQHELSRLRITSTVNNVIPNLNAGMFFEVIELADDERPAIQNTTKTEFTVRYVGQDGPRVKEVRVAPDTTETLIDLKEIVTDTVEYPTRDIYLGDISAVSAKNVDLDFDLQNQWDGIQWGLLQTSLGTFNVTGKKSARVFNVNSRIQSGQLPTTNTVNITGITGSTVFGQSTFEAIMNYFGGWAGTSSGGNLMPTGELVMNPKDASGIIAGLNFNSATAQNQAAQEILRKGWYALPELFGVPWKIVPDATLARKSVYVRSNKPAGTIWLKPSRNEDVEEVDRKKGKAFRWKKMCFGSAITQPQRPAVLKVSFTT